MNELPGSGDLPLWSSDQAMAATGGRVTGAWSAAGVSIDSRTLAAGDLFIALRGENHDAHAYVPGAFGRGAAAAVVTHRPPEVHPEEPLLLVDDTFEALRALGRFGRERSAAKVVGVTGSVGKTGTKDMLAAAFAVLGPTHASAASYNNDFGVPLTLSRLPATAAYGIIEMGMNHPGELTELSRLARPDVAIVTTVEATHLAHFDDVAAIAAAKAEIFDGVVVGGTAILNRDNPWFDTLSAAARRRGVSAILAFGSDAGCHARLIEFVAGASQSRVVAEVAGKRLDYKLSMAGRHWAINSLAVLATVDALGGDVAQAAGALETVLPRPGRGAVHHLRIGERAVTLLDESYNASPASMRAAFRVLAGHEPGPGGRRLAVLGDMLELGESEQQRHGELADDLAAADIGLVFTVGPRMAQLHEALPTARRGAHAARSEDIIAALIEGLREGDVITVKGSLGSRMKLVVEALLQADPETGLNVG